MGVFDKFSGIGVASGFKLQAKAPIDPRQVVDTIDDRDALITENGAYEGMQVYVKADKKTYLLKDLAAGTWEELGSGGGASELLTIEISVSITETTADVLKTYLNNNPDVLAELEAASSFILKVNKQNIATPDTYVFEQNYKDITTGAQHYFICVHAYGKTTTESTILWFSVESGVVKDVTFKSNDLSSGGGTSVQADYNQNDSTAADYIKNRPFYEETKTAFAEVFNKTLAFEWSTISNTGTSDNKFNGSNPMGGIRGGESVTVIFNGVEYNLTTQDLPADIKEEIEAYGGIGFVAGAPYDVAGAWQPTSDFPFTILYYGISNIEGESMSALTAITSINQASIPVIIKANKTTTVLHKIDPKYINDMYFDKEPKSLTVISNYTIPSMTNSGGEYYCSWHYFDADIYTHYEYLDCYNAIITIDNDSFSAPFAFVASDTPGLEYLAITTPTFRLKIVPTGQNFYLRTTEDLSNKSLTVEIVKIKTKKIAPRFMDLNVLTIDAWRGSDIGSGVKDYINDNEGMVSKISNADVLRIHCIDGVIVFLYEGMEPSVDASAQAEKMRYNVFFSQVLTKSSILTTQYLTITIEDGVCIAASIFSRSVDMEALVTDITVSNLSGTLYSIDSLLASHSRIAYNPSGNERYILNECYRGLDERVFRCLYSKEEGVSGYNLVLTRVSPGKDEYNYNITKITNATT